MKSEVVEIPKRRTCSNPHWLIIEKRFNDLPPGKCVRVTELSQTEINALRLYAGRIARARSFQRVETGQPVLYLYKK